jgi:hypothetical protein
MGRDTACMGKMRNVCKILVGQPGSRWEDNIKMDLREIEWKCVGGFILLRIGNSVGFW